MWCPTLRGRYSTYFQFKHAFLILTSNTARLARNVFSRYVRKHCQTSNTLERTQLPSKRIWPQCSAGCKQYRGTGLCGCSQHFMEPDHICKSDGGHFCNDCFKAVASSLGKENTRTVREDNGEHIDKTIFSSSLKCWYFWCKSMPAHAELLRIWLCPFFVSSAAELAYHTLSKMGILYRKRRGWAGYQCWLSSLDPSASF